MFMNLFNIWLNSSITRFSYLLLCLICYNITHAAFAKLHCESMRQRDIMNALTTTQGAPTIQAHTLRTAILATRTACNLPHTATLLSTRLASPSHPFLNQWIAAFLFIQISLLPESLSQALWAELDALPLTPALALTPLTLPDHPGPHSLRWRPSTHHIMSYLMTKIMFRSSRGPLRSGAL